MQVKMSVPPSPSAALLKELNPVGWRVGGSVAGVMCWCPQVWEPVGGNGAGVIITQPWC